MKQAGVKIDGVIYSLDGDIGHNVFLEEFLAFIERKGWSYGGESYQIDEENRQINDIDS
ncbi:hypothetical protein NP439_05310 [Oceanobacillus jeddahense]|uniref:Uncharacterized protein n=1 Tax=Oceanobacillus jeddahense TaxID=1462527 RepID=A0ABY5JWC4_9BACI|nr:hypothetical protein [Oceanobacillus jeddahense]UUI04105.1 hypothetical protein NP439_05310 [Oceanobacillus jeddahense]